MVRFIEQFKLTKVLSALGPQNIRVLNNNRLPRYARNDKQFTVHHSLFTQVAFTLAETLIVIGILGVVAALTLPNLNHATGDKERIAKVNKIYSALNDAFDRAQAVYGPYDEWFINVNRWDSALMSKRFGDRLTEFMKVSKNCKTDSSKDCSIYSGSGSYRFELADGTGVSIYCYEVTAYVSIRVDIDGKKGKNYDGDDQFTFYVSESKPSVNLNNIEWSSSGTIFNYSARRGGAAARWIIDYGNMDYLKADGNGVCPDGKTVLDGKTNTSCH